MFKTLCLRIYAEKLLRNLTIKNFKLVTLNEYHSLGKNNYQFITGKSRELNRICKSAQVTDKKYIKSDQLIKHPFSMSSINSNGKTCSLILTSQYSVDQSRASLLCHGLYTKAYTF